MPVFITTGGPISGVPSVLEPHVRTLADMIHVISDELDDTSNEYLAQIQNAIFSAIRFCELEALYFNESRDVVFSTEEGREWYDRMDEPNISTLAGLTHVYCEEEQGRRTRLQRKASDVLELLSDSGAGRGRPRYYTYLAQKLRLYPVPDNGRYRIRLELSPARLQDITSASEASPWFYEAFDLIKARAKYELYKDILKDAFMAMAAFNDFDEQLMVLRAETSRRKSTGTLRATRF